MVRHNHYTSEQRKRTTFGRFLAFFGKVFILIFIIWIGAFIYWINNLPKEHLPSLPSQSIVVLTGAQERLPKSIQLLEENYAERLFISGVNPIVSSNALFKQLPEISRLLKQKIDIGRVAGSTIGNALETQGWMRQNNLNSAIIVTSNWHIQRSLLEFRHIMPKAEFTTFAVESEAQSQGGIFWYFNKTWLLRLSKEFAKLSLRWLHFKFDEIF
ncbi:MAG: YdcF family protein [Alphaproteobacteria bacterium]